jgi:hypothetical protein
MATDTTTAPSTRRTVLVPVTLAGITRTVEATFCGSNDHGIASGFTARVGRGVKTHRANMTVWEHATQTEVPAAARRKAVEVDGRWYYPATNTVVLNRQATITGWAEDAAATSAHIMER